MLFASHGTQDMYPTFLQRQWHFSPMRRSAITAFSGVGAIIGGIVVGHLSDRLRGLRPLHTAWPVDDFQPSRDERIALQNRLAALGYTIHDFTGHFDFDLRDDVRDMQHKYSMLPDGYPSRAFLERIEERSP